MNDLLRSQIVAVLRSPSAAAVDFRISGVRVTSIMLGRVATAVEGYMTPAGRLTPIQVIVNPGLHRTYGYNGIYHYHDYFTFERDHLRNDHDEALVIHESVHAAFDMTRTVIPGVDNEAAAYLAQAIYFLTKGNPVPGNLSGRPIFAAAFPLAQSVLRGADQPTAAHLEPLREALRNAPNYTQLRARGFRYRTDGVRGL
ncbi:MAG: hypothetical protein ACM3TN_13340 [Alphaproteobacteria bacterium]